MPENCEIPDAALLLALLMSPGVGVVTVNRVAAALREAKIPLSAVVGNTTSVLRKGLPGGLDWAADPLSRCSESIIDRAVFLHERVLKTGGQWLVLGTSSYPSSIADTLQYDAPPLVSVYGDAELFLRENIVIVGSREPSERGELIAETLGAWAASEGHLVLSGGANGIDTTAHETTLRHGGNTCIVLPQGALTYRGPGWLQGYIDSGNAAVISQCMPDAEWSTAGAMSRNRTMAGAGRLVCVVDPGTQSGSRKSAEAALQFNRRTLVYAYDKVNTAYGELLRQGAFPLLDEQGAWDASYLENHWTSGGALSRHQSELF